MIARILELAKAGVRGQCPERPCPLTHNAGQIEKTRNRFWRSVFCRAAAFRTGGQDRCGYWPPVRALRTRQNTLRHGQANLRTSSK